MNKTNNVELKKISENYQRSSPNSTPSQAWRAGAKWMEFKLSKEQEEL